MVRQQAMVNGQGPEPTGPVLFGIVFFCLPSGLMEKTADTMCYLLCALSGMVLEAFPRMILTVVQWVDSSALGNSGLFFCLHLLVNAAPLLRWVTRAI